MRYSDAITKLLPSISIFFPIINDYELISIIEADRSFENENFRCTAQGVLHT